MKRVGRIALYLIGAILGLLAAALLAVNLYVQSQGTQARIQQELSQRLGTELRISRISVTPWWGLKLTGITIPQSEGQMTKDFLRADTFRLRISFPSLFARELIIKEVSLVNPTVVWAQNADGKWRLPASLRNDDAKFAEQTAPAEPERGQAATPSSLPPVKAKPVPAEVEAGSGTASFTPEVRRVNVANGNFRFLDHGGKPVANFEGFRFRSSLRNSSELRGNASIAKISLRERFFLQELKSPVNYDPEQLEFSRITAQSAGGEITGAFSMRPADPESPFVAKVRFRDVKADRLLAEAGGPVGMVQGRIEGSLDASGKTADANALTGTGEIYVRDGQVRQYSLLVALGQLLQIDELAQLRLDQAQVKFHITPGVVMIDELLLTSPNIRLSATGTIDFSGKLRLDSQLAINDRIRQKLFRGMRESFQPTEIAGYAAVPFEITGTIDKPKTNLMGKLVGRDLKDLGGMINDLLGSGKGDRAKKKKDAGRSTGVAAPSATPIPNAVSLPSASASELAAPAPIESPAAAPSP